jgi:hypothetical protein
VKTFRTTHAVLVLAGVAFLVGCATVYQGQFQFSHAWRVAEVVRVTPNMNSQSGDSVDARTGSCDEGSFAKRTVRSEAPAGHSAVEKSYPVHAPSLSLSDIQDAGSRMTSRSHAADLRTRRTERQIHSASTAPAAAQPAAPSAVRRGRSDARDSGAIDELVRWIS